MLIWFVLKIHIKKVRTKIDLDYKENLLSNGCQNNICNLFDLSAPKKNSLPV